MDTVSRKCKTSFVSNNEFQTVNFTIGSLSESSPDTRLIVIVCKISSYFCIAMNHMLLCFGMKGYGFCHNNSKLE